MGPSLAEIERAREEIADVVVTTPVHHWRTPALIDRIGAATQVFLKLELFQIGGSFKVRAATLAARSLSPEHRRSGVVTASGGNHAIGVALAARATNAPARVYMGRQANVFRQAQCRALGAEIILVDTVHEAFAAARAAADNEGLFYIHAFEGPTVALGTATVGLEIMQQVEGVDVVLVPIGGGGLCAGVSAAVKQLNPNCEVIGVEPEGADTMRRSFAAGSPQGIETIATISDSLGAPTALPYSFELCRRYVDDIVLISDDAMRSAMRLLFEDMKLVAEPAAAATTAALVGPLRDRLQGKKVCAIVCGSNIDAASFMQHLAQAPGVSIGERPH